MGTAADHQAIYRLALRVMLTAAAIAILLVLVWQLRRLIVLVFGAVVIAVPTRALAQVLHSLVNFASPFLSHGPLFKRSG